MAEYFESVVISVPRRHNKKILTPYGKQYTSPDAGGKQMHMRGIMADSPMEPVSFISMPRWFWSWFWSMCIAEACSLIDARDKGAEPDTEIPDCWAAKDLLSSECDLEDIAVRNTKLTALIHRIPVVGENDGTDTRAVMDCVLRGVVKQVGASPWGRPITTAKKHQSESLVERNRKYDTQYVVL